MGTAGGFLPGYLNEMCRRLAASGAQVGEAAPLVESAVSVTCRKQCCAASPADGVPQEVEGGFYQMKKKIFTAMLLMAAMASSIPVNAKEYTADGTGDCRVSAAVGSTYSVQVPASLELRYDSVSGKYEGSYTVAAKGSILPGQSVTVRPTAGTFVMTGSTTGEACQAAISQDVTEWVHPGRQAGAGKLHICAGEYTEAGGRVSAELTVPDTYTGEFTFAFSLGEYTE